MATVRWLVPHRVLYIPPTDVFTDDEATDHAQQVATMLADTPSNRVHVISDKTGTQINVTLRIPRQLADPHPKIKHVIIVGVSSTAKRMTFNVISQIQRLPVHYVATLQDALSLLHTLEPDISPMTDGN